MMSTVSNTQVAVKYRRNVCSLLIGMSADNRTTTLNRHIDRHIGRVSVDMSTNARAICRPIYRATHLDRHISIDTRPICRPPTYRSTLGRGVHKIHMIRSSFNGRSRERTALLTPALFETPVYLPYKLCIFTFPEAAVDTFRDYDLDFCLF